MTLRHQKPPQVRMTSPMKRGIKAKVEAQVGVEANWSVITVGMQDIFQEIACDSPAGIVDSGTMHWKTSQP